MSIYIHIGLRKTATTFMQREVFNNIQDDDFNYIELDDAHGKELIKNICFDEELYFDEKNIKNEFDNYLVKGKVNLISKEILSGDPYNGGIHRSSMLRKLKKSFPNGKIIFFLRKQDDYSLSSYITSIKRGSNLSIKEFYKPSLSKEDAWTFRYPNPTLDSYKYLKYIDYMYDLFGSDNILIIPFERFKENKSEVINDLCDFMNVKVPLYSDIKVNSSWGRYRIAYNRVVNLFVKDRQNSYGFWKGIPIYNFRKNKVSFLSYDKLIKHYNIHDYLNDIDRPYIDKYNYSKKLLQLCIEDNELLDLKYSLDLKKYGYY